MEERGCVPALTRTRGKQINVLLVDQGLSFGGALVVFNTVARTLGPNCNPILVTAIEHSVDNWIDTDDRQVLSLTPPHTYVDQFRLQNRARRFRMPIVQKLYLYLFSSLAFLRNLAYSYRLYQVIKRQKINIVHGTHNVFTVLAAVFARVPCVSHLHGIPSRRPSLWERILEPWIGVYLCISDYVAARAGECGYPQQKLRTIHNPVADTIVHAGRDSTRTGRAGRIRKKFRVQDDDFLVAIFGRIIPWKGQLELVKALHRLLEDDTIKLMLVGDSTEGFRSGYLQKIQNVVDEYGISDCLLFPGFVKDVAPYYQAADLVVHASIKPEPFGLVVVEAMSAKRPIIASDLGAPPELVDDGVDGFIVDPTDRRRLEEKVQLLATDPSLCECLGARGFEKVQARFLPEEYARRVASLYRVLLEGDQPNERRPGESGR